MSLACCRAGRGRPRPRPGRSGEHRSSGRRTSPLRHRTGPGCPGAEESGRNCPAHRRADGGRRPSRSHACRRSGHRCRARDRRSPPGDRRRGRRRRCRREVQHHLRAEVAALTEQLTLAQTDLRAARTERDTAQRVASEASQRERTAIERADHAVRAAEDERDAARATAATAATAASPKHNPKPPARRPSNSQSTSPRPNSNSGPPAPRSSSSHPRSTASSGPPSPAAVEAPGQVGRVGQANLTNRLDPKPWRCALTRPTRGDAILASKRAWLLTDTFACNVHPGPAPVRSQPSPP